jgi:hypothetical protein
MLPHQPADHKDQLSAFLPAAVAWTNSPFLFDVTLINLRLSSARSLRLSNSAIGVLPADTIALRIFCCGLVSSVCMVLSPLLVFHNWKFPYVSSFPDSGRSEIESIFKDWEGVVFDRIHLIEVPFIAIAASIPVHHLARNLLRLQHHVMTSMSLQPIRCCHYLTWTKCHALTSFDWVRGTDSNRRPPGYEPGTLTTAPPRNMTEVQESFVCARRSPRTSYSFAFENISSEGIPNTTQHEPLSAGAPQEHRFSLPREHTMIPGAITLQGVMISLHPS